MWNLFGGVALAAMACLAPKTAHAAEDGLPQPFPVDVHGFVSQGFMLSNSVNYLNYSRRGSFEFTEVGLNFTKTITDDLSVGMQLFARDLGKIGNYKPQFDWFYLDYHFRDWLGLRAGRTKLPFGLYNDTSDIDAARTPVLLPQSLYPSVNRDFLLAQTGFELYGYVPLSVAGAFDYRIYGGTIFVDSTTLASPDVTVTKLDVPYVLGGRATYHTPLDGLSVAGSLQLVRFDIDYAIDPALVAYLKSQNQLPASFGNTFKYQLPFKQWVASLEYSAHDLLFAAEYTRSRLDYRTRPNLLPDGDQTSTGWYVMGSYHVAPWFTPGAYYSVSQNGVPGKNSRDKYQQDLAVTTRYDITQNWLVKLEGHYMRGTATLDPALNSKVARIDLPREWGVFMLKTTAYF